MMDNETLMELTAEIVSAHVGHNRVDAADVPQLITAVYGALAGAGQPESATAEKLEPKVSIRSSVKPDAIACLECGARMKMLKRHLSTEHGLSPTDYRVRWGLASDYPMVAPDYSARRRALAVHIGLGHKPGEKVGGRRAKKAAAPDGE
jgi:predicted transcriptional regulator